MKEIIIFLKKMKHMIVLEIWDKIWDKITEELVTLIVLLVSALLTFFRKLPAKAIQRYRRRKQLINLAKGSKLNNIIRELRTSGALYIHIIRYHNGGPYKLTIEWEEIGIQCVTCENDCPFHRILPTPLQHDWVAVKVTETWNKLVVSPTISLDGRVNILHRETSGFDDFTKDVWESCRVFTYMEVSLKHTAHNETWCLGMSFCENFTDFDRAAVLMEMASRKIKKLL